MKITLHSPVRPRGFALIMVLILVTVSLVILASSMNRGQTVALLNQHNVDFGTCSVAAEAAVEKAYARMAYDFQSYGVAGVSNNYANSIYQNNIPNANEGAYWAGFIFSDAQGNSGKTYVSQVGSYSGPLPSAYDGLYAAPGSPVYRIISNVQRTNSLTKVIGTAQEDILLAMVPLVTWAIFYNGPLEFTQCATMVVNGRVHANGRIYVGTSASLTFSNGVSTTSILDATPLDGVSSYGTNWHTTFNATPGYTTNVASVTVSLNMTNSHTLIDIPPVNELATSIQGIQRLYNQAQMVLLVTNTFGSSTSLTVQLKVQTSVNGAVPGYDPTPSVFLFTNATAGVLATNLPFLTLTNTTYDDREYKTNLFTQVDIGRFATWIATNTTVQTKLPATSAQYPTILYVGDRRSVSTGQLASVRLVNGAQLPANGNFGFSVATPNPLYVWGNYNVQTSAGGGQSIYTNDTTYTVPAALLSDSLTVLSGHWTDSLGFSNYVQNSTFAASNNTINAAIVTGSMPSTGNTETTFSGGVHNLPRLLENWSSATLWLNTSVLRLWDSQMATNQFRNPYGFNPAPTNAYYNPPTRRYSFDLNYLDPAKVPPGIPVALVPIRFAWGVPPPGTITYTPIHN